MTSLPRFSVNNPILVNLFMIAVLGAGAIAALGLVREMFPESRPSGVSIITPYPGATPSEIEKGITLKIEEQVKDIDGAEKVVSTVSEGLSSIMVELEAGFENVDQAVNDVKSAIDSIPPDDFPEDALESNVSKFDPRLPVISVALYGDVTTRELKRLGEDLRDDLLALPGISKAVLSGTRKDEISVDVHPDKLVEYSLSFMDVAGAIKQSNLDLPGGQIKTSRANLAVRTLGEEDRGEALGDIIIRSDPSGKKVRLSDVATITDGFEDSDIVSRFGGYPAIDVIVFKTADEDAIHIAKLARALVAGKKGEPLQLSLADKVVRAFAGRSAAEQAYDIARNDPYPPGISVEAHTDLSRFIEGRLDLLQRNGVAGLFLVFLSLLVFLHWRVAFWVMMGLTLAVAGSLVCMHLFGQTLNLLTMFGLIVVLGLLVDDAIIVSEHVYTKIEHGTLPKQAAIDGAEEVTWPVVCAIVTTIIAFVPLMFIEGQMGDWMGVLPVIVCIALSVSLLEALTILPSHLAHGLKPLTTIAPDAPMPRGRLMRAIAEVRHAEQNAFTKHLRSVYERLLRLTTRYRYVTIAALFSLLIIAVVGLVGGGHVRFVFLQKMDSETIIANLSMEIGTPAERTTETIMAIEDAAMKVDERKTVFTLVGAQFDEHGGGTLPQSHLAQMWLEIVEAENRTRTSAEITEQLREKTADLSGVDTLRYTAIQGGPGGAAVHIEISSKRLEDIVAVTEEVKKRLGTFDGVYDIADDFDAGRREIQIELLDSATALGLTTESLATQVRAAFYGFEARKIQRGREDVKIMVRFPEEARQHIYDLERMWVATPTGNLVPFVEVARITEGTGFASIHRVDQRRTVTVTADVDDAVISSDVVMTKLGEGFEKWERQHPGLRMAFGGQKLETIKSMGSLKQNFLIVVALIYFILAGLFKSYVQPIIVLSIVPCGIIGAIVGHLVMGYPITFLSMIGIVALTGIVVNDSMILVSFINRKIESGMPLHEAVIEGGKGRMRAILLTSATTVLGIAPLLLERSFQAKFLIPMGISISAGLIFATLLTLIAVPSMYLIVNDIKNTLHRFTRWLW